MLMATQPQVENSWSQPCIYRLKVILMAIHPKVESHTHAIHPEVESHAHGHASKG